MFSEPSGRVHVLWESAIQAFCFKVFSSCRLKSRVSSVLGHVWVPLPQARAGQGCRCVSSLWALRLRLRWLWRRGLASPVRVLAAGPFPCSGAHSFRVCGDGRFLEEVALLSCVLRCAAPAAAGPRSRLPVPSRTPLARGRGGYGRGMKRAVPSRAATRRHRSLRRAYGFFLRTL